MDIKTRRCESGYTVMCHVRQLGRTKSSQISGLEFWDFGNWTLGFGWDLANVLKQCPYIALGSHILEFRWAEISSRWKFGLDLANCQMRRWMRRQGSDWIENKYTWDKQIMETGRK